MASKKKDKKKMTTKLIDLDDDGDEFSLALQEVVPVVVEKKIPLKSTVKLEKAFLDGEFIWTTRGHINIDDATPEEFYDWLNMLLPWNKMETQLKTEYPTSPVLWVTNREEALKVFKSKKEKRAMFKEIVEFFVRRALFVNKLPSTISSNN